MDERTETVTSFRAEVDTLRAMEEKLDSDIQISKQELAKANKALQAADKERIRYEKELAAVSPKLLETTEKVKGVRKRVVEIQKQLEKRRAERATREQSIISLEKELRVVTEEERKAREQLTRLDSESESGVQLDSSKLAEYSSLLVSLPTSMEKWGFFFSNRKEKIDVDYQFLRFLSMGAPSSKISQMCSRFVTRYSC